MLKVPIATENRLCLFLQAEKYRAEPGIRGPKLGSPWRPGRVPEIQGLAYTQVSLALLQLFLTTVAAVEQVAQGMAAEAMLLPLAAGGQRGG